MLVQDRPQNSTSHRTLADASVFCSLANICFALANRHEDRSLPSQPFGFGLVRAALDRDAVVVLARAARFWRVAIPELGHYDRVVTTRSVSNAAMSVANPGEHGFAMVAEALID